MFLQMLQGLQLSSEDGSMTLLLFKQDQVVPNLDCQARTVLWFIQGAKSNDWWNTMYLPVRDCYMFSLWSVWKRSCVSRSTIMFTWLACFQHITSLNGIPNHKWSTQKRIRTEPLLESGGNRKSDSLQPSVKTISTDSPDKVIIELRNH